MRINLITNLSNRVGLQKEYEILKVFLSELGHEVRGVQFDHPTGAKSADINIFDEVLSPPHLFLLAPRNWLFPHPEWWNSKWNQWLPLVERVLAKTTDTASIFGKLVAPHRVFWTGFMSQSYWDANVRAERSFLHVAGRSDTKNTDAVVAAWARVKMSVPLTVVADFHERYKGVYQDCGITFYGRVDEAVLSGLYNSNQFFLMPSAYEGWGHTLHEAMGCGALVLTTNAAPMSDFGTPPFLRIPPVGSMAHGAARAYQVAPADIAQAVETALGLPPDMVTLYSQKARQRFLDDNSFFKKRMAEALASV